MTVRIMAKKGYDGHRDHHNMVRAIATVMTIMFVAA